MPILDVMITTQQPPDGANTNPWIVEGVVSVDGDGMVTIEQTVGSFHVYREIFDRYDYAPKDGDRVRLEFACWSDGVRSLMSLVGIGGKVNLD